MVQGRNKKQISKKARKEIYCSRHFEGATSDISYLNPIEAMVARITERQSQYLSFISQYIKVNGRSPAESDIERHFSLTKVPFDFASYNVAPGRDVPVVRQSESGGRELVLMRWGLIPHWAKEERIGCKMINARAESVDSKSAFRQPFTRHRCLIPANGFYEWRKTQSGKTPYYIRLKDDSVMGFA
ncbi:MAG: SOS response-associated peptidase, partial [Pseudomonadota bacterium]|nr:SOS response-associated peptidase [Pseudomonadota bacterium]